MTFFDARTVEPDAGRAGTVPAGWYSLAASKLTVEPVAGKPDNTKMSAMFTIIEGTFKGRTVFHNFNLKNDSEKAQEIGHKQLSALCHATRILVVENPAQLQNVPFKAKLKVTPAEGQYEAKNEITAFRTIDDPSAIDSSGPVMSEQVKAGAGVVPPAVQTQWGQSPTAAAPVAPPPGAAPAGWQPPAGAAQPWGQPGAVPAAAPAAQPAWAAQPDPNAGQPVQQAPVQAPVQTAAPSPEAAPAPVNAGQAVPPWMQGAQTA